MNLEVLIYVDLLTYHSYIDHLIFYYDQYKTIFDYRLDNDFFKTALFKMISLDGDSIIPFMSRFYSHTGRPAKNQMEILRSFILMPHFRCFSPENWTLKLQYDPLLAIISGFDPLDISAFSSFYDFVNRFYLDDVSHLE